MNHLTIARYEGLPLIIWGSDIVQDQSNLESPREKIMKVTYYLHKLQYQLLPQKQGREGMGGLDNQAN